MFGIDSATWTRVSPLLDEALELLPGARAEWLERLRAGRAHDAALVEALLGQHDRLADSPFLEATAMAGAGGLAGASVGAYTLDTLLGSGGMGSVWRAHRSDGRFEGAVAVKLLHLSTLDGRGAERFAREATALARLGHPHIARLYDAGVTAGGQPYLVLQLVEGTRLDEFVAAVGLDSPAGWRSVCRCATPSPTPTRIWSCIAISSPRTSWSTAAARRCCSTSGSPSSSTATAAAAARRWRAA